MSMVKVCPACGYVNQSTELLCLQCDYDLSIVDITEAQDTTADSVQPSAAAPRPAYGRRCPACGKEQPISVHVCECGEKILAQPIIAFSGAEVTPVRSWSLLSLDGKASLAMEPGTEKEIGAAAEMAAYLYPKSFVSSHHGMLRCDDNGLLYQNLSQTNGTLLNGKKIIGSDYVRLSEGDILCLGGREGAQTQAMAAYLMVQCTQKQ